MSSNVECVLKTLAHQNVQSPPRGELFISQDFLDLHCGGMIRRYAEKLYFVSEKAGLQVVGVDFTNERDLLGLESREYEGLEEFFTVACIKGPFSVLVEHVGFTEAMRAFKTGPTVFSDFAGEILILIEQNARLLRLNSFNAFAILDDIADNRGLLCSFQDFWYILYPWYRKIVELVKSYGFYPFFHSDGNIIKIIDSLVEGGFICIHCIDHLAGVDLYELKRIYAGQITFMGHIDLLGWDPNKIESELCKAEEEGKRGGLIVGTSCGLSIETLNNRLLLLYPDLQRKPNNFLEKQ